MRDSDLDNPPRNNAGKRSSEIGQEDSDMEWGGGQIIACLYADENDLAEKENVVMQEREETTAEGMGSTAPVNRLELNGRAQGRKKNRGTESLSKVASLS